VPRRDASITRPEKAISDQLSAFSFEAVMKHPRLAVLLFALTADG
jgi:hypothetical protein